MFVCCILCVCVCEHSQCSKVSHSLKVSLSLMTWPSQQFTDVFTHYTIENLALSLKPPLVLCSCTSIYAQSLNQAPPVYLFAVLVQAHPPTSVFTIACGCCVSCQKKQRVTSRARIRPHFDHVHEQTSAKSCERASTLGSGRVFFFSGVNFRFSPISSAALSKDFFLFYAISPFFQCCDLAISSLEAHLSFVNGTADIMGSLCVYTS